MALTKLFQRYTFTDAHLNAVFQDYRRKMNEVIDYFLDTDFGSLALYDTDQSDILSLKWNENDSNPRDLNFKVNNANRTISMSGNLTVEGASLINSDLTTDANWATSGSITATSFIIGDDTLDTNEWAFLDGQDQALKTSDAPGFATGVTIGKLTLADGSITESDGAISFGNENLDTSGYVALKSNAELRFYDNGNYVGFEAPALGADCIWVLPTADGAAGEHMVSDGAKNLSWTTGAGTGDVSAAAVIADHTIVRGNGGAKGVQDSGVVIDDNNNVHIVTGAAGAITDEAFADDLIIEGSGSSGISIQTPDANVGRILFQSASQDAVARIDAFYNAGSEYLAFEVADSEAIRIIDGGKVGIGITAPDEKLHVKDATNTYIVLDTNIATGDVGFQIKQQGNDRWYIRHDDSDDNFEVYSIGTGSDCFSIDYTTGDVMMVRNLSMPSATSTITGGTKLVLSAGATGICSATIAADTTATAANMVITTDPYQIKHSTAGNRKYKDNIKDLELDTSLLYSLRPISFTSKCEGDDKNKRFVGLVADEVEPICPSAVEYNAEGEPEAVDYRAIQMIMLKEIQSLNERIKSLEEK